MGRDAEERRGVTVGLRSDEVESIEEESIEEGGGLITSCVEGGDDEGRRC